MINSANENNMIDETESGVGNEYWKIVFQNIQIKIIVEKIAIRLASRIFLLITNIIIHEKSQIAGNRGEINIAPPNAVESPRPPLNKSHGL